MIERWRDRAACIGTKIDFFDGRARTVRKARALCSTCPVADDCLDAQLVHEAGASIVIRHGVYGGATPEERIEIEKARRVLDEVAS